MEIRIKLAGVFRSDRFKEQLRQVPPGSTVRTLVEELQIPERLLGIVLLNGVHAGIDEPLREGDVVTLLPLLGGG